MPVIRRADSRRTETPAALMTTLASPAQGGAGLAVWRVEMRPGQSGPLHGIDTEQVWTVLTGGATVELGEEMLTVAPGDTVVMPADTPRRVRSDATAGLAAIVAAPAGTRAYGLDDTVVSPTCAAPDGDKLIPAWVV
jgi:quercetin dioxygenase-like cupin family protein